MGNPQGSFDSSTSRVSGYSLKCPPGKFLLKLYLLCRIHQPPSYSWVHFPSLMLLLLFTHAFISAFTTFAYLLICLLSSLKVKIASSLSFVFPILGTYYALKIFLFSGSYLSLKCLRVLKCIISLYKHIGENRAIYGTAKQSIYWTLLYDNKERDVTSFSLQKSENFKVIFLLDINTRKLLLYMLHISFDSTFV